MINEQREISNNFDQETRNRKLKAGFTNLGN